MDKKAKKIAKIYAASLSPVLAGVIVVLKKFFYNEPGKIK